MERMHSFYFGNLHNLVDITGLTIPKKMLDKDYFFGKICALLHNIYTVIIINI